MPPFTLIAATTRVASLSKPLQSRFSGGTFRLEFYTNAEIEEIIRRSSKILNIEIAPDGAAEIARRSRSTPRTANHFLKRCRDYAQVNKLPLDKATVGAALKLLGIDAEGLTASDRDILGVLINKFGGGPTGLNTLAAALSEEQATIEEFNEPYLLQLGFLERTPRGRVATSKAYEHIGLKPPENIQEKLL